MTSLAVAGLTDPRDLPRWRSAGGTHVLVQLGWDVVRPDPHRPAERAVLAEARTRLRAVADEGLQAVLELCLHYPPAHVLDAVEPFVDQHGVPFLDDGVGMRVRNWVWSATGRRLVGGFLDDCGEVLAGAPVDRLRIGGGWYGEVHYPPTDGRRWWAYGPCVQDGADRAWDLGDPPRRGWVPPPGTDPQDPWIDWYVGALGTWTRWLARRHREAGFAADLHVLHPGWGLRPDQPASAADQAAAAGEDPARVVAAYADLRGVRPWCTWADGEDQGDDPAHVAPWRALAAVAARLGVTGAWCENAVGANDSPEASAAALAPVTRGPYTGMMWVTWSHLTEGDGRRLRWLQDARVR